MLDEESKRVSKADDLLGLTENRRSFLLRSLTNSVIDLSKGKSAPALAKSGYGKTPETHKNIATSENLDSKSVSPLDRVKLYQQAQVDSKKRLKPTSGNQVDLIEGSLPQKLSQVASKTPRLSKSRF